MSVASLNCNGVLAPRTKKASERGTLEQIDDLLNVHDFLCLQEVGMDSDTVPPLLAKRLEARRDRAIAYVSGAGLHTSVAVVLSNGWQADKVERHPSGRAIAVTARKGLDVVVVISVYQPSGLDNCGVGPAYGRGVLPPSASQREARRVTAAEVYTFVKRYTGGFFVIGGDLNETRSPADRGRHYGGPRGAVPPADWADRRGSFIGKFLGSQNVVVDLYRRMHPNTPGFTFTKRLPLRTGATFSRIDYILVPAFTTTGKAGSWTVGTVHVACSDHRAVVATFTAKPGASAPSTNADWSPGFVRIGRAGLGQRRKLAAACERRARAFLRTIPRARPGATRTYRVRMLDRAIRRFHSGMRRALSSLQPGPGEARRGGARRRGRARRTRDALLEVKASVERIWAGDGHANCRSHRAAVGRMQGLLGCFSGTRHDDLSGLRDLVDLVLGDVEFCERLDREIAAGRGPTRGEFLRDLFQDKSRAGEFVERYLRSSVRCVLDRGTLPDGSVTFDPEEYKPLIRKVVSAPMSTRVELPAPYDGVPRTPDLTAPFGSTDARARGCRPAWWDRVYSRDAKGVAPTVWDGLMAEATPAEISSVVRRAEGGKSPGHDGCDIDFWKLVTDPELVDGANGDTTACLLVLLHFVNECIALGEIPPTLKAGWITLVPKVKEDGSFSCDAPDMRPITVLPEMGKIVGRLLARRIDNVLVRNPGLLSCAQRGFQMDGYVGQCTGAIVDVIEDWRRRKEGVSGAGDLYVVSYDQSKAYDSVQEYTIRASLERFNMPELFIRYAVSCLHDARSRVRTAGGLTAPFAVRSGVRQGDPLAPLLYAFVTDALHEGMGATGPDGRVAPNPLFPSSCESWGYTLATDDPLTGAPVRICSSGYADDTIIVATSLQAVLEMQAWVREFFGAHCFTLNCEKTKLLCSDGAPRPALASVAGTEVVEPGDESVTIRYLGLWINLGLDWTVQIDRMRRAVWWVCGVIKRNHFDICMSLYAVQQYLLPCIRLGLLYADVTDGELRRWDARIRQTVMRAAGISMWRGVGVDAFYVCTGLPRLTTHRWALRGEELMIAANSRFPSSFSCRARLRSGARASNRALRTRRGLAELVDARFGVYGFERPVRVTRATSAWARGSVDGLGWRPHLQPVVVDDGLPWAGGPVRMYTDGSTGPVPGEPSGCSVVCASGRGVRRVIQFPCRASGNNFLAEVVAIIAALQLVPASAPVEVYSDSLAAIGAANRGRIWDWLAGVRTGLYAVSQRARAVAAARPAMNMLRATMAARRGTVVFRHVRAHTGCRDVASRMNAIADAVANRVRRRWEGRSAEVPYHVWGEHQYRMRIGRVPVIGSYRRAVLRAAAARELTSWAQGGPASAPVQVVSEGAGAGAGPAEKVLRPLRPAVPHARRLAAACGGRLAGLARVVRKSHDPVLMKFFLLAATEFLPVERRLVVRRSAGGRGEACKLCGAVSETVRHVYVCTSPASLAQAAASLSSVLRVLSDAGVRLVTSVARPLPEHGSRWHRVWFDLSGKTWMQCAARWSPPDGFEVLRGEDGLGALLGVLPQCVDDLLSGVRIGVGRWRPRGLRALSKLKAALQLALVRGAWRVYRGRCRQMDRWWRSPDAAGAVAARRVERAVRARRRGFKSAARALDRFLRSRPRRLPMGGRYPVRARSARTWSCGPFSHEQTEEEFVSFHCETAEKAGVAGLPWF